jgi:4-amino-4-deoxy-L-arabinose transferase-like glycosyltransferase
MISHRTVLVALFCLAWILPGLIGHDPWKPDEAYTFGVVYGILKGGSWVVPALAGEPFLDKPPLAYLVAAASAQVFSAILPLHDAARLATGFWMALTFAFTAVVGREFHGTRYGAVSALLLLGCCGLVVRSHQLITDVAMLAGFAIAYYGFALSLRRPAAGGAWIGTGAGIAFLANGLLAPAILALIALLLPVVSRGWRGRGYAGSMLIAAGAAAPWLLIWPLLLYLRSEALFEVWLWDENIGRYFGKTELVPDIGTVHYLRILPWYAWPVWALVLWVLWRERLAGLRKPAIVLPLVGFLVTLGVLSGSADARELYALPLLLPLSLLAVPAPETLRRGAANAWYWFSAMTFTFFVAVFWFYWSGLELGIPARLHEHLHRIRPGYEPGFKWLPFSLALAYTLAWFAVLFSFKRSPMRPVVVWAAGMTAVWALTAILFIGWVDNAKSYRSMIAGMTAVMPKQYRCVSSRELGEPQRALLHYFAGIITEREEGIARSPNCDLLLVQGKPHEEFAPRGPWKKIWEGNRPGDKDERYRLYLRTAAVKP